VAWTDFEELKILGVLLERALEIFWHAQDKTLKSKG
jgi:hypothetical protein